MTYITYAPIDRAEAFATSEENKAEEENELKLMEMSECN